MPDDRPIKSKDFRHNVTDRELTDLVKGNDLITIAPIMLSFTAHKEAVSRMGDVERIAFGGTPSISGGTSKENVLVSYTYLRVFYREGHYKD